MNMTDSLTIKNAGIFHSQENGIIISSRIRLARNLSSENFVPSANEDALKRIYKKVSLAVEKSKKMNGFNTYKMSDISEEERRFLLECRFISKELYENKNKFGGLYASDNLSYLIMINEEDHLRIQSVEKGLSLKKIWKNVNTLDSELESNLDFAFSKHYGYLTACPSNLGTGIRASVMMHLPLLVISELVEKIARGLNQLGIVMRGANGEGSEAIGNIYQISNQRTLGCSESEIVESITDIAKKVETFELDARAKLFKESPIELFDKISRAWGTLKYCELINSSEALGCLSLIKLGCDMGFFPKKLCEVVDYLMMNVQCAHLISIAQCPDMKPEQRDIYRACYIKEAFKSFKDPKFFILKNKSKK